MDRARSIDVCLWKLYRLYCCTVLRAATTAVTATIATSCVYCFQRSDRWRFVEGSSVGGTSAYLTVSYKMVTVIVRILYIEYQKSSARLLLLGEGTVRSRTS